jgi:hypothetical protein
MKGEKMKGLVFFSFGMLSIGLEQSKFTILNLDSVDEHP